MTTSGFSAILNGWYKTGEAERFPIADNGSRPSLLALPESEKKTIRGKDFPNPIPPDKLVCRSCGVIVWSHGVITTRERKERYASFIRHKCKSCGQRKVLPIHGSLPVDWVKWVSEYQIRHSPEIKATILALQIVDKEIAKL